jgi:hypothetical protein
MREERAMRRVGIGTVIGLAGVVLVIALWRLTLAGITDVPENASAGSAAHPLPLLLEHKGSAEELERAPVAFDHDKHTAALKQSKMQDCGTCHRLTKAAQSAVAPEVQVFDFPKTPVDWTDKTSIMNGFHAACAGCHEKMASEGKKTGPRIGLCGLCHVRRPMVEQVKWAWSPIFTYKRHYQHITELAKLTSPEALNIAPKVVLTEPPEKPDQRCFLCHHQYDAQKKILEYKKNTENACGACHKEKTENNVRSMQSAAHAACIGCHMKIREQVIREVAAQGRTTLTDEDKKRFGPFQCKDCHGEHKELSPQEIRTIPRLVRGQKDVMDLALVEEMPGNPSSPKIVGRMKTVVFNHKTHETRAQFCNSCHHHSLEKCSNCHTLLGDPRKGGGISFQEAFHKVQASPSCAGCHAVEKSATKCSGCHKVTMAALPQASCPVCHRGPSNGKPVDAPACPLVFDKEKVPEKLEIKTLAKEFKPVNFPHQKIVAKLTSISNDSSLARVFHAGMGEETLCSGCHHNGQPGAQVDKKWPKCDACHGHPFNQSDLPKPGLQIAYHQQCMGCHRTMGQKPTPLECEKCHAPKEPLNVVTRTEIPLRGYR